LNPALKRKVFGIGLNKTGTKSLGAALSALGYRVCSWDWRGAEFTMQWHEKRFTRDMGRVLEAYDAFEDLPWPLLFEQLDQREPDALFVLTVRESPERWLSSIQRHIAREPTWVGHYLIYGSYDPGTDAELYLSMYRRHVERVTAHFADRPGKLLVLCMDRGEGWAELAHFVGARRVPTRPFPHLGLHG